MARTVARKLMPTPTAEMIISKLVFNILEKADIFLFLFIANIPNREKEIRPDIRTPNGSATCLFVI